VRIFESRGRLAVVQPSFKGEVIVAGDIHGDLRAFKRIREQFLRARDPLLVLLGDYADRGPQGLEVVGGVEELLREHEGRVVALKGNHEDYREGMPRFSPCDLPSEVETKRGVSWREFFPRLEREFLSKLRLAVLIPKLALLVHGGISSRLREPQELERPSPELEEALLWSDPWEAEGELPNPRGAGVLFGPDVSEAVTKRLGIKCILRSHEPRKALEGPWAEHEGRVLTLSSTRVYGGKPFILRFKPEPPLTPQQLPQNFEFLR
jgi:hypothetical protein